MVNALQSFQAAAFQATRRADEPTPAPAPAPAPEPAPAPAGSDISISYNSQDDVVFGAQPTTLHNVTTDGGLATDKAKLNANLTPNADGAYVYDSADQANYTSALSFSAAAKTIDTFSQAMGAPISWAFDGAQLGVNPDAGEDFNAYYARDEKSINFFHGADPVTNQTVMSGASGEVVSHETGHAILDGLRPAYFSSWTPDVGAFHESFGDMMGICMSFQDDRTRALVAQQTAGDLSKENAIAQTGEQLGVAINDYVGQNATGGPWVRDAINNFKWADPNTLPWNGPPDQLSSEVHSFSRLWTGAFYDIVSGIQARNMAAGMDADCALKCTGDEALKMLANSMKEAPQADFTYRDMANAWISADQKYNNGANADLLTKVFTDRGILGGDAPAPAPTPDPQPPTDPSEPDGGDGGSHLFTMTGEGFKPMDDVTRKVFVRLSGPEFGMFQGARVETLVDKDGSLGKDAEVAGRVKNNVSKAIAEGRIRYNDPNYKMKLPQDLFDSKGRPYLGVTRWENGQMIIERSKVAN
jgi:hypothetical protein